MKQQKIFWILKHVALHQTRDGQRGGEICCFIQKGINFKVREDLSKSSSNAEIFSVEIENKNSKKVIISDIYKAPCADFKLLKTDFKEIIPKVSPSNKSLFLTGDINIISLEYSVNSVVKQFFNLSFQNGEAPLLTDPQDVLELVRHTLTRS